MRETKMAKGVFSVRKTLFSDWKGKKSNIAKQVFQIKLRKKIHCAKNLDLRFTRLKQITLTEKFEVVSLW